MQMKRCIQNCLAGLLVAGLAAGCTASVGAGSGSGSPGSGAGPGSPGAGSGGNTGTAGSGSPGVGGGGATTGTAGNDGGGNGCVGTCVCVKGIPATSQIPRMTRLQYDTVVKELLGVTTLASAGNQPPSSLLGDDSTGPLTDIGWNGYLSAGEKIATEVIAGNNRARFTTCPATATGAALTTCLTNDIKSFGRKAFRRPVTDAEVTSFLRFQNLTPAGTTNEIIESVLYAFLAAPSFIALPELNQTTEAGALKLTSYEVATRL